MAEASTNEAMAVVPAQGTVPKSKSVNIKSHKEAKKALNPGVHSAIVDIKVSRNEEQVTELSRYGYEQLFQEELRDNKGNKIDMTGMNTFGNKISIWFWRRSEGTCSGRLKPIVDIQLEPLGYSSDFILSGYICDPTPIAGNWLWTRRAQTDEEEKDAIVELAVTTGKMKINSDPIWRPPDVGWIHVDGNFSKSFFGGIDSFLWFKPERTRSLESYLSSPIRTAVHMTEEARQSRILANVRMGLRHHVPLEDIKRLCHLSTDTTVSGVPNSENARSIHTERMLDYSTIYHKYDKTGKMKKSKFLRMLYDVGLRLDKKDGNVCYNFFAMSGKGFISHDDFSNILALTDHELDLTTDKLKAKLLSSIAASKATLAKKEQGKDKGGVANDRLVKSFATLSQVFRTVNSSGSNILNVDQFMDLAGRAEVYFTEEESRKILTIMDLDGDHRVEEQDFVVFMGAPSTTIIKRAFRVREAASQLRRWLIRGTSERLSSGSSTTAAASEKQWAEFRRAYEQCMNAKFPEFLGSQLLTLFLNRMGPSYRLSSPEARELSLMVAPKKSNGRILKVDIQDFMSRSTRSLGEMSAILHRELLRDLYEAYAAHRAALKKNGREDPDLVEHYLKLSNDLLEQIATAKDKRKREQEEKERELRELEEEENKDKDDDDNSENGDTARLDGAAIKPVQAPPAPVRKFTANDIIGVEQLKIGIESTTVINDHGESINTLRDVLNMEEYVDLAILFEACASEGDTFGIKPIQFLQGFCQYAHQEEESQRVREGHKVPLDVFVRDLKISLYKEARFYGTKKKANYKVLFDLLDEDKNGSLGCDEFIRCLKRLQLTSSLSAEDNKALVDMFDKRKRGVITLDDFVAFIEDRPKNAVEYEEEEEDDEEGGPMIEYVKRPSGWDSDEESIDVGDDMEGMESNVPPASISRDADCDWLLWFLYKEAYRADPLDPEMIVTELQQLCAETELSKYHAAISVKDLWNIMYELRLQGGCRKDQFLKGIRTLCEKQDDTDEDKVDYEALCKLTIRMGRAFNAIIQERAQQDEGKFEPLLQELKNYFNDMAASDRNEGKISVPRYEKIFRRLDNDHDGFLTTKEFKKGLHKLHYRQADQWNMRMVRKLFDTCDENRDGLLSIKEFGHYILGLSAKVVNALDASKKQQQSHRTRGNPEDDLDEVVYGHGRRGERRAVGKNVFGESKLDLSDDEEDAVFNKHRALTDHELIRKVNEVLHDIVPVEAGMSRERHTDIVRSSVRRFFQRADPEFSGCVSAERFSAFIRRSSLQDRLNASELRRLTDKLKRKGTGKARFEALIDYEKLCQLLAVAPDSIARSRADVVFSRFQQAAAASAQSGRSFMNLCSLSDLRLTGRISRDELMHTARMMDFPMTMHDMEAMLELLPSGAVSRDHNTVDYRILQNMLQMATPTDNQFGLDPSGATLHNKTALPTYATPGSPTRMGSSTLMSTQANGMPTPLGLSLTTPYHRAGNNPMDQTLGASGLGGSMMAGGGAGHGPPAISQDKAMKGVMDRLKVAVEEKTRVWGAPYSLRRGFEVYDNSNSGLLPLRTVQSSLEELGMLLTAHDLYAISSTFGRKQDDKIYYDSLCRAVDNWEKQRPGDWQGTTDGTARDGATGGFAGQPSYLNHKVIARLVELRQQGRDPRDLFDSIDLDQTGMIPAQRFRDVIYKVQLLQTDHQVTEAIEDFASISNRAFVNYQDFCAMLEKALLGNNPRGGTRGATNNRDSSYVYGSGFDGTVNNNLTGSAWRDDTPRLSESHDYGPPPSHSTYGGANTGTRGRSMGFRERPIDLEEGSSGRALSPPRPTESLEQLSRKPYGANSGYGSGRFNLTSSGNGSPNRYRLSDSNDSWGGASPGASLHRSIQNPRSSPSQVGKKMWGSGTPLAQKGNSLKVGGDKWCCSVCLYVENDMNAPTCAVCDTPNYNTRKEYQVKEQCPNCTFHNGQFAETCEMCGKSLSRGASSNKRAHGTPASSSRGGRY